MSHLCNQLRPNLSFAEPEHYGAGFSVKQIDFQANQSNPPFKATYFQVLPGYTTPVDKHKVEECWIVLQGQGTLEFDGQSLPIAEKDILHFPSFKGHSVKNDSLEPLLLCSIYW